MGGVCIKIGFILHTTKFHFFLLMCSPICILYYVIQDFVLGWSGGAMVLGKLPVPGRPTIWITVGQGPTALAVGAGGSE